MRSVCITLQALGLSRSRHFVCFAFQACVAFASRTMRDSCFAFQARRNVSRFIRYACFMFHARRKVSQRLGPVEIILMGTSTCFSRKLT